MTTAVPRVDPGFARTVTPSERDLEGKETERCTVFRERAGFAFGDGVGFSAIPRAVVAMQMIASSGPNRNHNRHMIEAVATPKTQPSRRSSPLIIIIACNGNLHQRQDMSTGAVINHGVSGFPVLGIAGDFQEQRRGEPWQALVNDPIRSYLNAQSHIGQPLSNFNEPWNGGNLQEINWNGQPYRAPVFGEPVVAPPTPNIANVKICPIDYPTHIGQNYPQQLPSARIHEPSRIAQMDRQNTGWEGGPFNMYTEGDNKFFMAHSNVQTTPYSAFFQGSNTGTGVHPGADTANQQTAPNTTRPDFKGGQAPTIKLPNGQTIGMMQPQEPPALYELAPPPDPQVIPGEGTAPLRPTNPTWW